jgi:branched-chain amino acid transport system ATP-binding protein
MMVEGLALLEVSSVSKRFGGLLALADVSFSVEPGRITSLIGPNGAGKTTLFHIISGFLRADSGSIAFDGRRIDGLPPHRIARLGIARTFQDLKIWRRLTVLENVLLGFPRQPRETLSGALLGRGATDDCRRRALEILETVELGQARDELAENLSYGDQKLLTIARLLAADARLLLLDEPVSGLPGPVIEKVVRVIRALMDRGRTTLLVDHNMEAVMGIADWVVVLDHGRVIAAGTPREVQKNEQVVKTYLGTAVGEV